MSVTLLLPGEELPMTDPELIRERLEHDLDLVIDGGACNTELTSVIDLADDVPNVIRVGRGEVSAFES
jgi:tRNA A37 threonylcarbamoyladenosine synthetase subunit TsaC/SUA5/YrdC